MKIKYAVYKGSVGLYAKEYFDKKYPEAKQLYRFELVE